MLNSSLPTAFSPKQQVLFFVSQLRALRLPAAGCRPFDLDKKVGLNMLDDKV